MTAGCRALHTLGEERGEWGGCLCSCRFRCPRGRFPGAGREPGQVQALAAPEFGGVGGASHILPLVRINA